MKYQAGDRFQATIVSHGLRTIGDKLAVSVRVEDPDGVQYESLIFLTEKARNVARAQLKMIGFDLESRDLWDIEEDDVLLGGKQVEIEVEDYNGRLQFRIPTSDTPTKKAVRAIQRELIGREIEATPAKRVKPASKSEAPAETPIADEEDIPF